MSVSEKLGGEGQNMGRTESRAEPPFFPLHLMNANRYVKHS